ncbi:MAG: hypothetical protein CUN54_08920, partial [Phototrophicales bacterium]
MAKPLSISLVVHDDYTHIFNTLDSLYHQTETPFDAYVTINTPPSPEGDALQEQYPDIHIRQNATPQGFATNHNVILREVETRYILVLNDDVTLKQNAIDTLVKYLDDHEEVGLVGPFIENPDGSPQQSAFNDPSLFRMIYTISGLNRLTRHGGIVRQTLQRLGMAHQLKIASLDTRPRTRAVPVIRGVAMLVRRDACMQAGVMDEDVRFYGEEMGWHLRIRQHGWRVVLVAEARIIHHNEAQDLTGWKLTEHRKSILAYFTKYRP